MSELPAARTEREHSSSLPKSRLESWKAIAEYLGRHITTVQRWEQEEGLPVHRHLHEKRGSVYGYAHELDAWLAARSLGGAGTPLTVSETVVRPHDGSTTAAGTSPAPVMLKVFGQQKTRSVAWAMAGVVIALLIVVATAETFWNFIGATHRPTAVAVLPLINRSPDQQPDYFVDGMTEALVTDLAALPAIRVIARQSVMQYRNSGKPASSIARELSADALVEGSVQRSGSRVRVDIRLIDGKTSGALWASTYERDEGDALALQSDISRAIVRELHLTLAPGQGERLASRRPSNPAAWDAYLRARFFWNKRTHEDMSRAIDWYERAIQLDPAFPLVYAGLADVYASLGPPKIRISELIARGTAAAEQAIRLDPTMGEPYAALGKLRAYAWDWHGAETNFRTAIERAPGYAPARYWFGAFLANQARCDEALAQARDAERLDPVSLPGTMVVAMIELRCGRIDRAISRSRMIVEFDPAFGQAYEFLGRAYAIKGDLQSAIGMFERALTLTGGRPTIQAALAVAYAAAGRRTQAEAIATELEARHNRDKVLASAWSVALANAGLGRNERALDWLEHAYADREEWLEALATDERFINLRSDTKFQRLLSRLGLPNQVSGLQTLR